MPNYPSDGGLQPGMQGVASVVQLQHQTPNLCSHPAPAAPERARRHETVEFHSHMYNADVQMLARCFEDAKRRALLLPCPPDQQNSTNPTVRFTACACSSTLLSDSIT